MSRRSALRQCRRVNWSCAWLSAISRPSNASRKSSGEPVPRAVWEASDCTVASVFFTRWFNSSTSSFCRSSASLRSVMSCTTRTP